jgi:hypothetical protein
VDGLTKDTTFALLARHGLQVVNEESACNGDSIEINGVSSCKGPSIEKLGTTAGPVELVIVQNVEDRDSALRVLDNEGGYKVLLGKTNALALKLPPELEAQIANDICSKTP